MPIYQRMQKQEHKNGSPKTQSLHRTQQQSVDEEVIRRALNDPNPQTLTAGVVLQLQRTIGNQAVSQLVKEKKQSSLVIQRNPITERLTEYMQSGEHSKIVNRLAQHLLAAMDAIGSGNWATADAILYNKPMAKQAGHSIDFKNTMIEGKDKGGTPKSQDQINGEIERAIGKGMYFAGKLLLPTVAVMPNNVYDEHVITPSEDQSGRLGWLVYPVVLEEWIHMFQHQIHGLLSQGTEAFQLTPEVQENLSLPEGTTGKWNMNEVDIYATYRDLGWNQVLDNFRGRYQERQKYEDFLNIQIAPQQIVDQNQVGQNDDVVQNDVVPEEEELVPEFRPRKNAERRRAGNWNKTKRQGGFW